ncbi:MAG: hypothetical protein RLZZ79_125 [Actinomycetota bacterium]
MKNKLGNTKSRREPSNAWRHIFIIFMMLFAILPLYIVIMSSLNGTGVLSTSFLYGQDITLENYRTLFNSDEIPFLRWVINSVTLAGANAVISVIIGVMAAFAFSRLKFKGKRMSLRLLLLIQVFPSFLALAAIYVIMERVYKIFPAIGIGTVWGLLLVYLGGSMGANAWLLKGFLDSVPMELDEAAKIDGASPSQIFRLIFLPLSIPILVVTAILTFIGTFNEFVLASIFLTDVDARTIAVGLQSFVGSSLGKNWGAFAAGSVLASIPLVAIFLSLQKYIVGGVTAGAIKG